MPKKSGVHYECERCERDWFSEKEVDTAKIVVRFQSPSAASLDAEYDILCDSCAQTVENLVRSIARELKKLPADKSKAKKERPSLSPPNGSMTVAETEPPSRALDVHAPASHAKSR